MNEKDFERISDLFSRIDARFDEMEARFDEMEARFDARFEKIDARLDKMDTTIKAFKREIISEFNHSLKIKFERLSHDIRLYGDGLAFVTERVDEVHRLSQRTHEEVEKVSLNLLAHRRDLEAHNSPDAYLVKENETGFGETHPVENGETEGAELRRRLEESRRKYDAVTEEINAYCAEKGVELPKIDGEEVIRQIRLQSARYRVDQELMKRPDEGLKPE